MYIRLASVSLAVCFLAAACGDDESAVPDAGVGADASAASADASSVDALPSGWTMPDPQTDQWLWGVWGSGVDDVVAVGLGGVIVRYRGDAWAVETSATTRGLRDIWGSSASDIFAVGDSGTIVHYDGEAWSVMDVPATGGNRDLLAVWGSGPGDVYAAGYDKLWHYDGDAWSAAAGLDLTTATVERMWGTGPNDIYAVGANVFHHFDGDSWDFMTPPAEGLTHMYGVTGAGGRVFASGASGTIVVSDDGQSWASMTSNVDGLLHQIWAAAADDVYAVGSSSVIHYDGASWTETQLDLTGGRDVWSDPAGDVFVVGNGAIAHYRH